MVETCCSRNMEFYGRHLLLNFAGCQIDLNDIDRIKGDMITAVNAVGATILGHMAHKFDPYGVSVVLLLSESHASVHTYPEYNSCFLDLFTCGRRISVEPFGEILAELWRPERIFKKLQERYDPSNFRVDVPILSSI